MANVNRKRIRRLADTHSNATTIFVTATSTKEPYVGRIANRNVPGLMVGVSLFTQRCGSDYVLQIPDSVSNGEYSAFPTGSNITLKNPHALAVGQPYVHL